MSKRTILFVVGLTALTLYMHPCLGAEGTSPASRCRPDKPGAKISPTTWGILFGDMNFGAYGGSEVDNTIADITAPQWVKLNRTGNTFTAEYSASESGWTKLGSIDIAMAVDTYIGLCLTSHNTTETCTAEFSNVLMPASATGQWENEDIGITSNIAEQLYVVLQDSAGNSSPMVSNSDPAATTIAVYTPWNIPLTGFTGVNLTTIRRMTIGVGDRNNPKLGGAGDLYIDDIRLQLPAQ